MKHGALHRVLTNANISQTNRTPLDCMRQGIPRQRHTWNEEFDKKLYDAVQRYGIDNWSVGTQHTKSILHSYF